MVRKLQELGINTNKTKVHRLLTSLRASPYGHSTKPQLFNRKLTQRALRALVRLIRVHGIRQTGRLRQEMAKQGIEVSTQTIRRALKSVPTLQLKRPRQQQFMTTQHMAARLAWAREALREGIDWSQVFFADEKVWFVDGPAWRPKLWCDKRDAPLAVHRKGVRNGAIHVWGAFSLNATPRLFLIKAGMKSADYCHIIAKRLPLTVLTQQHTLFHDRHPCHVSKETQRWMSSHNVNVRLFPPKDADINPIENLWGVLTRKVFVGTTTYKTPDELYKAVKAAWQEVQADKELRASLVGSMTERLQQLVRKKGGPLRF